MGRKAFIDQTTKVLKCVGYVLTNEPGDIALDVADSFALIPGFWTWDGTNWNAYTKPLTQDQQDVVSAKADAAISALSAMTPAQAKTWVQNNVSTLADAKTLLGTLAAVICILSRRL